MSSGIAMEEAPSWPNPLVETFDSNWPDLTQNDTDAENWLLENKKLLIRTVTWNLCAKAPPAVDELTRLLLPRNKFHLYFVGSEECERSIAQSAINPSKKNWENYLIEALGDRYVPIRSHTLQAIHLMAFAHKSVAHMCSLVTSAAVATGAGNTMGNKGGVAVYLTFGSLRILVVNAHLAAHQNAERQRNNDFHKINRGIPVLLEKKSSTFRDVNTTKHLATIAEEKPTPAASLHTVVDDANSGTTDTPSGNNQKMPGAAVHRSIDVGAEPTFGLAFITTPAMRQESVQMIGKEVDGAGPLSPIDNPTEGIDAVASATTGEGISSAEAEVVQEEEPRVIEGAQAGSVNGPSEMVVRPSLSIASLGANPETAAAMAAAAAALATEDPGDEDDGDAPDDGANTVEEGLATASNNSSKLASGSVDGIKTPRPRSTSTDVSEMGLSSSDSKTLDQCADVVIFMGDLNYRIKGNRSIVSRSLEANMHDVLLNNDQLRWNMNRQLVLKNFTEPPLNFRPTYKLDVGTVGTYDTGPKHRIPAWADRILYVHNPQSINCIAYNSDVNITTSDHKPIYASFVVELESYVSIDSQQNIIGKRLSPKFTSESQVCSIM